MSTVSENQCAIDSRGAGSAGGRGGAAGHARLVPVLLVLFVGSGCAALMYEVVWFQLLQLVIGSSAVSIGVLLGTFMGGMCLGSLVFSRFVSSARHPLAVYALLELGIGVVAVAVTLGMPLFDRLYIAVAAPGASAIALRAVVCAICLLPPTILMGATLPAISRWIESTPRGVSWLGFFYGGNTAGAVAGCLLAGFYLLRQFDMTTATFVAAAINVAVAGVGLVLAASTRYEPPAAAGAGAAAGEGGERLWPIYVTVGLSGAAALGAEVVWTRLLSLLLGGTVYTFSIILAVFLAGLGIGSSAGAVLARGWSGGTCGGRPKSWAALGVAQALCAGAVAWTAYAVATGLPNWPVDPYLSLSPGYRFQLDLARCLWAILPPTLFWGASFPLALSAAVAPGRDPARVVGRVYAANTVGAIAGALLFSMVVIPHLGTQTAERLVVVLAGVAGVVALGSAAVGAVTAGGVRRPGQSSVAGLIGAVAAAIGLSAGAVGVLWWTGADQAPWQLTAYGRRIQTREVKGYSAQPLYVGEGMNSSVAVTEEGGVRMFHVSGKVEASSLPDDMRLQYMLGHFPALFHPKPKSVLIVGCGAGVTAGSFILHKDVERIVICEIEPLIPQVVATYFSKENNNVVTRNKDTGKLMDKRVEIVYDDARHYILTTKEKFDVITSDPIHPWVKGAATLYTKEYFELVKSHLNPGGMVTQWVPLYESSEAAVKSEMATFFQVFPNGTIWNNDSNGAGYDVMVLGSNGPLKIDAAGLQRRLDEEFILTSILQDSRFGSAVDILKTYAGRAEELGPWLRDAVINSDRSLRLQYLAGESLNEDSATTTINDIVRYRKYPEAVLDASPAQRAELERLWGR
jgi:spermidine synthase